MAYNERFLRRAEAMMADTFLYRDGGEHSLAELLAPGFFPSNQRMTPGDVGLLFARDGAMWVEVIGRDLATQRPMLRPFVTSAPAEPVEDEQPKLTRKAA